MTNSPAPEALFVRLYFDRHIIARLAIDLRSRGYDVLTTEEAGLDTASDEQQLAFATAERRTILSFNIRDFAPLHTRWWRLVNHMPGSSCPDSWADGSTACSCGACLACSTT